jgi:hypothetical protein
VGRQGEERGRLIRKRKRRIVGRECRLFVLFHRPFKPRLILGRGRGGVNDNKGIRTEDKEKTRKFIK